MHCKYITLVVLFLIACSHLWAISYDSYFTDRTLRLQYIFSGDSRHQSIALDEMCQSPRWYGRRANLDSLLLRGNGQIVVSEASTDRVLYRHSFSTLFQEWQSTEEATQLTKSFENVFLVPFPKQKVSITVTLTDTHNKVTSSFTHVVDPSDILIRYIGEASTTPWEYVYEAGDPRHTIDVALVAEGYTASEMDLFLEDCRNCMDAFHAHEPFKSLKDKFNFIAVKSASDESGVTIPHKDIWKKTALRSNFDTFYSERYLTTLHIKQLHELLAGIPYEHIIILANTDNYGGGGVFNSYNLTAAHHGSFRPVVVHEFGHSYGGLGDEYFYDDQYETMYPSDTEPWEPNLTTLVDFESKWKDMLPAKAKVPSKADGKDIYTKVGVYEGGGYQSKGVYRPVQECRMKINEAPVFCPVCDRAIRRITSFYLGE